MKENFQKLDTDRDECLSQSEFRQLLSKMDIVLNDKGTTARSPSRWQIWHTSSIGMRHMEGYDTRTWLEISKSMLSRICPKLWFYQSFLFMVEFARHFYVWIWCWRRDSFANHPWYEHSKELQHERVHPHQPSKCFAYWGFLQRVSSVSHLRFSIWPHHPAFRAKIQRLRHQHLRSKRTS